MLNTGRPDLRFLRKTIYTLALEYIQLEGAKCGGKIGFGLPLGKSLNITEYNEGLSLVDTRFAPGDRTRPVKK